MAPSATLSVGATGHCAHSEEPVVSPIARKEGISDSVLKRAVELAENGLVDADLGGGVIKQRMARSGQGKSGGYRAILFFRRGDMAVFVYGFSKSQLENISKQEERAFREAAQFVLALSAEQLRALIERGDYMEVQPERTGSTRARSWPQCMKR